MTGHDDFDRTLAGWFEADALAPAPPDGLDRIFEATRRRRPRPAWLAGFGSLRVGEVQAGGSSFGVRSFPGIRMRWSTALIVLLVIAALIGGAILVGARLFQPSPPGDRLGHLAYGLDGDIFVADWDGKDPVRIADGTPGPGPTPGACLGNWGEGPMWSPDGRHLAFRSTANDRCGGLVVIVDLVSKAVASFPGTGWLVSWSPDSTRVASWVDLGQTIGVYGVDGLRQALLTVPSGCQLPGDFDPIWSPDGTSLMISPCVIPLDGRTPGRVGPSDPRSHFEAAYSRDGARLAFVDYQDTLSLVIAMADGTELRTLPNDPSRGPGKGSAYGRPVLSPTGDRVAFMWSPVFSDQAVDPASNTDELRLVDVASGTVTTLASARGASQLDPITFSPEGDRILVSRTDARGVSSLWSIRTDGSDAHLLVTGTDWGDWQSLPTGP